MNFYIKQNSNLPYLQLELDCDENLMDRILNSVITISMWEKKSCRKKIYCDFCEVIKLDYCNSKCADVYAIEYKFPLKYTNKKGHYIAEIKISFNDNQESYRLPLNDILNVYIE